MRLVICALLIAGFAYSQELTTATHYDLNRDVALPEGTLQLDSATCTLFAMQFITEGMTSCYAAEDVDAHAYVAAVLAAFLDAGYEPVSDQRIAEHMTATTLVHSGWAHELVLVLAVFPGEGQATAIVALRPKKL